MWAAWPGGTIRRPVDDVVHRHHRRRRPVRRRRPDGRRPARTSGNFISHRSIEKVFPTDRHSGVAIAGAAGPAVEMVRLFQLQLEHYEKVEGFTDQPSRARRTSSPRWSAATFPPPCRAWRSCRSSPDSTPLAEPVACSSTTSPAAGTRNQDHASTGSGRPPRQPRVVKLGWREGLDAETPPSTSIIPRSAQAADEDSATGGADVIRGIYPGDRHHHRRGIRTPPRTPISPSATQRSSSNSPTIEEEARS